jgi:DNA invertase Pin-like site-specific DNA recombinase
MRIGYARVSATNQSLSLQRDALLGAGCERIFTDTMTGTGTERPELSEALATLKAGDTLIVWKLDRLGRSLSHLVLLFAELCERGVKFRSLSDPIDTTNAGGRSVIHIMSALSEFERSIIVERTHAGLAAARKRGQRLGRKPSLTSEQIEFARKLIESGESPRVVARSLKVGRSTLYRHLPAAPSAEANL